MAAKMAAAGSAEVTIIARGPHLVAMQQNGLKLISDGAETVVHPRCVATAEEAGVQDVVIVTLNMPGYQGSGELLLAGAVLVILIVAPGGVIGWSQNVLGRMNRLYKERGNR